jgi:hypothetical protein
VDNGFVYGHLGIQRVHTRVFIKLLLTHKYKYYFKLWISVNNNSNKIEWQTQWLRYTIESYIFVTQLNKIITIFKQVKLIEI